MPRMFDQYLVKETELLRAIYNKWPVNEEQLNINQATILPTMSPSAVGKALLVFESLGILTKRMTYGDPTAEKSVLGRRYHYTLLVSREAAEGVLSLSQYERKIESDKRLADANERGAAVRRGRPLGPRKKDAAAVIADYSAQNEADRARPDEVVLATDEAEEVRAIIGDEPNTTLRAAIYKEAAASGRLPDEAAALIEAARQYQNRGTTLKKKVDELAAVAASLGMTVDAEVMLADVLDRVAFEEDAVLDTVVKVLPYITTLEQRNERLGGTIVEQREKLKGFDELRNENRRLHEQNQRLISSRVTGAAPVARA